MHKFAFNPNASVWTPIVAVGETNDAEVKKAESAQIKGVGSNAQVQGASLNQNHSHYAAAMKPAASVEIKLPVKQPFPIQVSGTPADSKLILNQSAVANLQSNFATQAKVSTFNSQGLAAPFVPNQTVSVSSPAVLASSTTPNVFAPSLKVAPLAAALQKKNINLAMAKEFSMRSDAPSFVPFTPTLPASLPVQAPVSIQPAPVTKVASEVAGPQKQSSIEFSASTAQPAISQAPVAFHKSFAQLVATNVSNAPLPKTEIKTEVKVEVKGSARDVGKADVNAEKDTFRQEVKNDVKVEKVEAKGEFKAEVKKDPRVPSKVTGKVESKSEVVTFEKEVTQPVAAAIEAKSYLALAKKAAEKLPVVEKVLPLVVEKPLLHPHPTEKSHPVAKQIVSEKSISLPAEVISSEKVVLPPPAEAKTVEIVTKKESDKPFLKTYSELLAAPPPRSLPKPQITQSNQNPLVLGQKKALVGVKPDICEVQPELKEDKREECIPLSTSAKPIDTAPVIDAHLLVKKATIVDSAAHMEFSSTTANVFNKDNAEILPAVVNKAFEEVKTSVVVTEPAENVTPKVEPDIVASFQFPQPDSSKGVIVWSKEILELVRYHPLCIAMPEQFENFREEFKKSIYEVSADKDQAADLFRSSLLNRGKTQNSKLQTFALPELKTTENRYVRTDFSKIDPNIAVIRNVQIILNKLTPEFFGPLSLALLDPELGISSNAACLEKIAYLIFEKAMFDIVFVHMYAGLCMTLCQGLRPAVVSPAELAEFEAMTPKPIAYTVAKAVASGAPLEVTFRRIFLKICQNVFSDYPELIRQTQNSSEKKRLHERLLNTALLVSELYLFGLVTNVTIVHSLEALRGTSDYMSEGEIEILCKMWSTVGKNVEISIPVFYGEFASQFAKQLDAPNLSNRCRFMIQDVIDLANNKWVPRRTKETAKRLDDLHREMKEQEAQSQRIREAHDKEESSRRNRNRGVQIKTDTADGVEWHGAKSTKKAVFAPQLVQSKSQVVATKPSQKIYNGDDSIVERRFTSGSAFSALATNDAEEADSDSEGTPASFRDAVLPSKLGESSQNRSNDNVDKPLTVPVESVADLDELTFKEKVRQAIKHFFTALDESLFLHKVKNLQTERLHYLIVYEALVYGSEQNSSSAIHLSNLFMRALATKIFDITALRSGFIRAFEDAEDLEFDSPYFLKYCALVAVPLLQTSVIDSKPLLFSDFFRGELNSSPLNDHLYSCNRMVKFLTPLFTHWLTIEPADSIKSIISASKFDFPSIWLADHQKLKLEVYLTDNKIAHLF